MKNKKICCLSFKFLINIDIIKWIKQLISVDKYLISVIITVNNIIKEGFMPFYKAVLRAGHTGRKKHRDLTIYAHYNSYEEALNDVKKFPMVKHHHWQAIQSLEQIDEREYIVGILHNSYYFMSSQDVEQFRSLDGMVEILNKLDDNCVLETKEAKELKEFCNRYAQANDKNKRKIEKKYFEWAVALIEKYENEVYNFPNL